MNKAGTVSNSELEGIKRAISIQLDLRCCFHEDARRPRGCEAGNSLFALSNIAALSQQSLYVFPIHHLVDPNHHPDTAKKRSRRSPPPKQEPNHK